MAEKTGTVNAQGAPAAVGPYSHARWAGDLLYISGQLGLDPAGGGLAEGVEAQTRQAMQNLGAILEAAGLGFKDLVKINAYLADMNDFGVFNEIYGSFFGEETGYPARACVQVGALPLGGLVEVEAVACRS